jgi:hypothetical protein
MRTPTPEADLIFAAVLQVAIIAIVVGLWGKGRAAFRDCQRQLQERGYVVQLASQQYRGPVTLIWGRYAGPTAFYLQVSNRDPIASAAGRVGIADLATGEPAFDDAFIVRSNHPDWALEFLTPAWRARLMPHESVQFLTSSIGNLFSPDYWPGLKQRSQRDIWMLRVDGRLAPPQIDPYVILARDLAAAVERYAAARPHDAADLEAPALEGR